MENKSSFSLAQSGNLTVAAGFIIMILRHYRIEFISESEIVAVLGGLAVAIGVIISWIGRYRAGGIDILGRRV